MTQELIPRIPGANFTPVKQPVWPPQSVLAQTENQHLIRKDRGAIRKVTSGTFTQTFDPVQSLGEGWAITYWNAGTGDVTVTPSVGQLIDGLTSYIMYPKEARVFYVRRTGETWTLESYVLNTFFRTFTANGTFTTPPGYGYFAGLLWGGGASGAKGSATPRGGPGGGGGACVPFALASSLFGVTETITIAAVATGPSAASTDGVAGNSSTLGALVTAYGGGAADFVENNVASGGGGGGSLGAGAIGAGGSGGAGGAPSVAAATDNPGYGGGGGASGTSSLPAGKSHYGGGGGGAKNVTTAVAAAGSFWGGGGGGSAADTTNVVAGGVSLYGGNGGAGVLGGAGGVDGSAPAGGGGGTTTGTKAGDGARGELRIWGVV